jgi:hypothetical protein
MTLARRYVEAAAGTVIRAADIRGAAPAAVSRALSRLAQEGVIQRVRKGYYYVPKETLVGTSRPSEPAMARKVLDGKARPTGITAANLLGMTTQVPAQPEFAAYASAPPRGVRAARLYLRPRARMVELAPRDAALLEFLRDRGRYGELGAAETYDRLFTILTEEHQPPGSTGRLRCLRDAALLEPPRVRAILGALMQGAGLPETLWEPLRGSLNTLSRFDFGLFRELPNAREWQAK